MQRYQEELDKSIKGIHFIFDSVDALHYNHNEISLNRGGLYIDSPEWLKNEKTTINPKNNDDKCFQCALTVALSHEQIKIHLERTRKIKLFIDQYNWKEINFQSHKKDWKKFESNDKLIGLNILYIPYNTKEITQAYKSKYNLNPENQIILLIITDGKKWHYLAVKRLYALLREITFNNNGEFYCLNCFHPYSTKDKLEKHKKVFENHDCC